jgi:hypothetical protein
MSHYLGNSGRTYTINLEGMVHSSPSAGELLKREISLAMNFVQGLQVGTHYITSGKVANGAENGAYNNRSESRNWFFAVAGYSAWGKGRATVTDRQNGPREYTLEFEYKFYDDYNWDGGKGVMIPVFDIPIDDEILGDFHRGGMAREFTMLGSIKRRINWSHRNIPAVTVDLGKGR